MKSVQVLAFTLLVLAVSANNTVPETELFEQQPSKLSLLWNKIKFDWLGLAIGLIAVVFAIPFLYFNERRAINRDKVINWAEKHCEEGTDDEVKDDVNDKLVHVKSVKAKILSPAKDTDFGISPDSAAKLVRQVDLFQILPKVKATENSNFVSRFAGMTAHMTGAEKDEYIYEGGWSDTFTDSFKFTDKEQTKANEKLYERLFRRNQTFTGTVDMGKRHINAASLVEIGPPCEVKPYNLTIKDEDMGTLRKNFHGDVQVALKRLNWDPVIEKSDGGFYLRQNKGKDTLGDLRVTYKTVELQKDSGEGYQTTIVGAQTHDTFAPFQIKKAMEEDEKGCHHAVAEGAHTCCSYTCFCYRCCDCINKDQRPPETLELVYNKAIEKDHAFDMLKTDKAWIRWAFRIFGVIVLAFGLYLLVDPIVTIIFNVHILGQAVSFWEIAGASLLTAVLITLVVGGLAWFFFKPWVAYICLGVGLGVLAYVFYSTAHAGANANKEFLA